MVKADVEGVLARNSWFASLPAELSESILHAGKIRHFESSMIYFTLPTTRQTACLRCYPGKSA